jgi:hypothetical protein
MRPSARRTDASQHADALRRHPRRTSRPSFGTRPTTPPASLIPGRTESACQSSAPKAGKHYNCAVGRRARSLWSRFCQTTIWRKLSVVAALCTIVAAVFSLLGFTIKGIICPAPYSSTVVNINGNILIQSPDPLSQVTILRQDKEAQTGRLAAVTAPDGQFSIKVPRGWSGTLTRQLPGYSFEPAHVTYDNVSRDICGLEFTATKQSD